MKKVLLLFVFIFLISCEKKDESLISVISREDGSGTRGSFVEIFKIFNKDENGKKIDAITTNAEITNSTSVMITTVELNKNAIGYISLGTLNNKVKALKIDDISPTIENVKNGSYKIQRPFLLVTNLENELSKDFINFILSNNGQKIIESKGYVGIDSDIKYKGNIKGKIVISGSSSIAPILEVLIEEYKKINLDADIILQQSDSTTGVNSIIEKIVDIAMVSRELKESEKKHKLNEYTIAKDAIVVIVNNLNPIENISSENIRKIFNGEIIHFGEILNNEK